MSTTAWKPKNLIFFSKFWNWWDWILSIPRESAPQEKKSPWFHLHQSYIINWYINGKVFSSTTAWRPKIIFFFSKNFKIDRIEKKSPSLRQYQSYISNWYNNGNVFMSSYYSMETQKLDFFCQKSSKLNFDHTLNVHNPENKSPWLRQYQSYISNWYINGKVFTSTTTWKPNNLIFFFQNVQNWI